MRSGSPCCKRLWLALLLEVHRIAMNKGMRIKIVARLER
jgi:hypothetical protein